MNKEEMAALKALSRDVYTGKTGNFSSGVSGDDAMRKLMYEALDINEDTSSRAMRTAWDMNKPKVFQIIDIALDAIVPTLVTNQFDSLANVQTIALGDVQRFTVKNKDLFKVGMIAAGTQNLRRQNIENSNYTVNTEWYGVKTYGEFEGFLTGTIDWAGFVDTIARSFVTFTGEKIYNAFATSYDSVRTNLKAKGTFELDTLLRLARHVRATSGSQNVKVYGTVSALSAIASKLELSEKMKDKLNENGYLTTVRGIDLYAFPDGYKAGTQEFIVNEKSLLIIPGDEKIVDVVYEGDTQTIEGESSDNTALQLNFDTRKKMGIQVKKSSVYGFYELT